MTRFIVLAACVALLAVVVTAETAPALNRPLIDATNSNPEKLKSLATLSTIVAKEPAAASVKTEEELNPVIGEDAWNGEDETPEGRQRKQAQAIRNEIKGLKTLISQGEEIVKVLPVKTARLATLKKQLLKIDGEQIRAAAAEKLAKQQSLLKQVKSQENAIAEKLNHLKATHAKIKTNMDKVHNFLKSGAGKKDKKDGKHHGKKHDKKHGKKDAKKAAPAAAPAKPAAATPAPAAAAPAKAAFLEQEQESEQESESESEVEAESETEVEAEQEAEAETEAEEETQFLELEEEMETEEEMESEEELEAEADSEFESVQEMEAEAELESESEPEPFAEPTPDGHETLPADNDESALGDESAIVEQEASEIADAVEPGTNSVSSDEPFAESTPTSHVDSSSEEFVGTIDDHPGQTVDESVLDEALAAGEEDSVDVPPSEVTESADPFSEPTPGDEPIAPNDNVTEPPVLAAEDEPFSAATPEGEEFTQEPLEGQVYFG